MTPVSCGLRSFLGLLHSFLTVSSAASSCGLRSFLGLLHCCQCWQELCGQLRLAVLSRFATLHELIPSVDKRAAACGPFSVCYTSLSSPCHRSAAAACGPFSVCYTQESSVRIREGAAACGPFSVCYTIPEPRVPSLRAAACGPFSVCYTTVGASSVSFALRLAVLSRFATLLLSMLASETRLRLAVLSRFATLQ